MTAPDSDPESVDPFDPDSELARRAAQERLVMDYPVELEWPDAAGPEDADAPGR